MVEVIIIQKCVLICFKTCFFDQIDLLFTICFQRVDSKVGCLVTLKRTCSPLTLTATAGSLLWGCSSPLWQGCWQVSTWAEIWGTPPPTSPTEPSPPVSLGKHKLQSNFTEWCNQHLVSVVRPPIQSLVTLGRSWSGLTLLICWLPYLAMVTHWQYHIGGFHFYKLCSTFLKNLIVKEFLILK